MIQIVFRFCFAIQKASIEMLFEFYFQHLKQIKAFLHPTIDADSND